MKLLAKAGAAIRQWSQHGMASVVFGCGTLCALVYVSSAAGHWT
jgi:hypothetical protein